MQKDTARPLAIGPIVLGALVRVTQALNSAPVGSAGVLFGLHAWPVRSERIAGQTA